MRNTDMARKTVQVSSVIEYVNNMLRNSFGAVTSEERLGMIDVLEQILHDTGNYRGYRYLTQEEVPSGEKPGIHYAGDMPAPYPERFKDTDHTRRAYAS
jgi:hypothetical protein